MSEEGEVYLPYRKRQEGPVSDWHDVWGCRHLELSLPVEVMPYVRQTRYTRFRPDYPSGARARRYNQTQHDLEDMMVSVLRLVGSGPFLGVPLGLAGDFSLPKPARCDLGNLLKALEDALVGARLIPDDRWIYGYGPWTKTQGPPSFYFHLWELYHEH